MLGTQVLDKLLMSSIQMLTQLQDITDNVCLQEHLLRAAVSFIRKLPWQDSASQKLQV